MRSSLIVAGCSLFLARRLLLVVRLPVVRCLLFVDCMCYSVVVVVW